MMCVNFIIMNKINIDFSAIYYYIKNKDMNNGLFGN